ncbi:hypothetical protein ACG1BZ_10605 [Microbulbifer sp. CNSA002]|uniref:hypothetical protein n=1 Tax=Microbulbifer sp. CNSA002 TaxID=3373604 RepID=UPI0039B59FE5
MMPRYVKLLSLEELEQLSTERLLAYLRKLHQCEDSVDASDFCESEAHMPGVVFFKESDQWRNQYKLVKEILSARPHIDKVIRVNG